MFLRSRVHTADYYYYRSNYYYRSSIFPRESYWPTSRMTETGGGLIRKQKPKAHIRDGETTKPKRRESLSVYASMSQPHRKLFLKRQKEHRTQEGHVAALPQGRALFFPELREQAPGAPPRPEPRQGEKLAGFQGEQLKWLNCQEMDFTLGTHQGSAVFRPDKGWPGRRPGRYKGALLSHEGQDERNVMNLQDLELDVVQQQNRTGTPWLRFREALD